MTRRRPLFVPIMLALAAVALGFTLWFGRAALQPAPEGTLAGSGLGGPFALVDQDGRGVTDKSYAGRYRLMYFGYTFCPDVCPVDTAKLMAGVNAFKGSEPGRAARLVPIFVTVDPARDDVKAMKGWSEAFPGLTALTGSQSQVDAALKAFRVYAQRGAGSAPDSYLMDHMAIIYLMDGDNRPVEFLPGGSIDPGAVTAMLAKYVR